MDIGSRKILARRRLLDEQLAKLKDRMTGRANSFYPFILNRSGEISERKLDAFISELAGAPVRAMDSCSFFLSRFDADAKYKKLCKCFLYCAVQGIADHNEEYAYPERTASLFSDIVRLAEHKNNTFFKSEEMLFQYEFEASMHEDGTFFSEYHEGGFFRYCDVLYSILTGKDITDIIPKELYSEMLGRHLDKKAKEQGYASAEEYADAYHDEDSGTEDEWNEYLESLDEAERAEVEKENEAYAELADEADERHRKGTAAFNERYLKTVISPEKFVKNYLTFRRLFFALPQYKRRYFFDDIVLMTDAFLYEHGLSPMMDDDAYAGFDDRTDRLSSAIDHRSDKRGE